MLKILMVTPIYPFPEYRDGTRKILTNLLKHLSSKFQFEILTLYQSADEHFFSFENHYSAVYHKIPYQLPTKAMALLKWSFRRYPFNPNKFSAMYRIIANYVNQIGPQCHVIHFATPFLAPVIEWLPPILQKKTILFPGDAMSLLTYVDGNGKIVAG